MSAPNPLALIIALLLADNEVAALVGARVRPRIVDDERKAMPQPYVVVTAAGGPGRRGKQGWRKTRIDTACYGATLLESWDVHAAVRDALENAGRDGALLSIEMTSDGVNDMHPTLQWPVCYATYAVLSTVVVPTIP